MSNFEIGSEVLFTLVINMKKRISDLSKAIEQIEKESNDLKSIIKDGVTDDVLKVMKKIQLGVNTMNDTFSTDAKAVYEAAVIYTEGHQS